MDPAAEIVVTDPRWMPVCLQFHSGPLLVEWWHVGDTRFDDPFVVETFNRVPFPARVGLRSTYEAVRRFTESYPSLAPAGFIFHLSRCGSTLVSRVLASDSANRVMSEPPVLGEALGAPCYVPGLGPLQHADWVRWTVAALGHPLAAERRYFIKFNSWAITFARSLRQMYPETPFVFIFRDPFEILASQHKDAAFFMTRGFPPHLLGMTPQAALFDNYNHMARVVASFGNMMLHLANSTQAGRLLLVDYRELPQALLGRIYPFLGLPCGDDVAERLAPMLGVHAKTPQRSFDAGREKAAEHLPAALREAGERWVAPVYRQLLEARDRIHA